MTLLLKNQMANKRIKTDRVIIVGYVKYKNHCRLHQQDFIQSAEGICRTIIAGTHASTPHFLKTLIKNEENTIENSQQR